MLWLYKCHVPGGVRGRGELHKMCFGDLRVETTDGIRYLVLYKPTRSGGLRQEQVGTRGPIGLMLLLFARYSIILSSIGAYHLLYCKFYSFQK